MEAVPGKNRNFSIEAIFLGLREGSEVKWFI